MSIDEILKEFAKLCQGRMCKNCCETCIPHILTTQKLKEYSRAEVIRELKEIMDNSPAYEKVYFTDIRNRIKELSGGIKRHCDFCITQPKLKSGKTNCIDCDDDYSKFTPRKELSEKSNTEE
jgi:plasmid replication initiation protein